MFETDEFRCQDLIPEFNEGRVLGLFDLDGTCVGRGMFLLYKACWNLIGG